eukprot:CAMPEP_0202450952 /NCGR_PEP_ID=MMETSP1360-20130828/9487_1 /ASSEMBLY_ACC=CAM_ASM_000848 /TAXON_ID=515479 /ORGANISM="Licmophora paradoxa, Strain CCMP2313" /LENGTH=118 /DNA_ID=CAMNT_0049069401 /DNA_START=122 /DNA_END=478 /DNA_ORIENTATION=+
MGLVYHLEAADSSHLERSLVKKALHLYNFAYELLLNEEERLFESSLFRKRLLMAILNNMAHLNHELMCYESSSRCFSQLSVLAVEIGSCCSMALIVEECQSFLLNAMVMKPPIRAPAA